MGLGERAKLDITSDFAYGRQGAHPVIPPNADLVFEVELLAINDQEAPKDRLSRRKSNANDARILRIRPCNACAMQAMALKLLKSFGLRGLAVLALKVCGVL